MLADNEIRSVKINLELRNRRNVSANTPGLQESLDIASGEGDKVMVEFGLGRADTRKPRVSSSEGQDRDDGDGEMQLSFKK